MQFGKTRLGGLGHAPQRLDLVTEQRDLRVRRLARRGLGQQLDLELGESARRRVLRGGGRLVPISGHVPLIKIWLARTRQPGDHVAPGDQSEISAAISGQFGIDHERPTPLRAADRLGHAGVGQKGKPLGLAVSLDLHLDRRLDRLVAVPRAAQAQEAHTVAGRHELERVDLEGEPTRAGRVIAV
jgi:hypothetical protein